MSCWRKLKVFPVTCVLWLTYAIEADDDDDVEGSKSIVVGGTGEVDMGRAFLFAIAAYLFTCVDAIGLLGTGNLFAGCTLWLLVQHQALGR